MPDTSQAENAVSSLSESEYDVSLTMSLCSATHATDVTELEPNNHDMVGEIPQTRRWKCANRVRLKEFP